MKPCGLVPNFHIYVSMSDLCVPTISPPILLQQNRRADWKRGHAVSFLGIHKSGLVCSALFSRYADSN
jgi:hypothetical protein